MSGYFCQPCDVYEDNRRNEPTNTFYKRYEPSDLCYSYPMQERKLKSWYRDESYAKPGYRQIIVDRSNYRNVAPKIREIPTNLNLQTVFKKSFRDNATAIRTSSSSLQQISNEKSALARSSYTRITNGTEDVGNCNYIHAKVEVASSCCSLKKESSCNTLPSDYEYQKEGEERQIKCSIQIKRHASDTGSRMPSAPKLYYRNSKHGSRREHHSSERFLLKPRRIDTNESCNLSNDNSGESDSNFIVEGIVSFVGGLLNSPIIEEIKQTAFGFVSSEESLTQLKGKRSECAAFVEENYSTEGNSGEAKVIWNAHKKRRYADGHYSRKKKRYSDKTNAGVVSQRLALFLFFVCAYFLSSSFVGSL